LHPLATSYQPTLLLNIPIQSSAPDNDSKDIPELTSPVG
jgi:hypothetical protein